MEVKFTEFCPQLVRDMVPRARPSFSGDAQVLPVLRKDCLPARI